MCGIVNIALGIWIISLITVDSKISTLILVYCNQMHFNHRPTVTDWFETKPCKNKLDMEKSKFSAH
jgi:hypothetical protein